MSNAGAFSHEVMFLSPDACNGDVLFEVREHPILQEKKTAAFVLPAWVMLKKSVAYGEGQDCIVISVREMNSNQLEKGSRDVCVGVATLQDGRNHPCLILNNGEIGIDAETVLDAHTYVGESLLLVFDCKEGCVLVRTPFTAQLQSQLQAIVEVKELLPRYNVRADGKGLQATRFPVLDTVYFGFA